MSKPPTGTRLRKRHVILLAIAAILLIGVIANLSGSGKDQAGQQREANSSSATATPHASSLAARAVPSTESKASAKAAALAKAKHACIERPPASGDIYVRVITPGMSPRTQQLGGRWSWNHMTHKCVTSVQRIIAAAPRRAGNCTQVGYVSDNPGYDANAMPAAPMADVVAHAGPACATRAPAPTQAAPTQAAPTQAAPTAAQVPPSTAPAGCYPLTNGGNCYEPGEFCRASDHGVSGVAGDGESITCLDNDGWRWEPA
jgi:hypothetical protein